jgi:MoxR-like ATPase
VTTEDVAALARPVLRHRVICSFAAQASGLASDAIVDRLLAHYAHTRRHRHPSTRRMPASKE